MASPITELTLLSYRDAARYSAFLGDAKAALAYAEKLREVEEYSIGTDHEDYHKAVDIVMQLRHAADSKEPFNPFKIRWYDYVDDMDRLFYIP